MTNYGYMYIRNLTCVTIGIFNHMSQTKSKINYNTYTRTFYSILL